MGRALYAFRYSLLAFTEIHYYLFIGYKYRNILFLKKARNLFTQSEQRTASSVQHAVEVIRPTFHNDMSL